MSDEIEKLAKAIHDGDGVDWDDGGDDVSWEAHSDRVRGWCMRRGRAALRHLGCVTPAGEVFVPDVATMVAALRAAESLLRTNWNQIQAALDADVLGLEALEATREQKTAHTLYEAALRAAGEEVE